MDQTTESRAAAAWYAALASRDARFDGRFYVGVTSTGIYCRPVCRVRLPRASNCRFFRTAAEAEAHQFRPCLRCRPEQAPGWSTADIGSTLTREATRLIDSGGIVDLTALHQRLGISARHLRRLFERELGVPPSQYLRTHRLLLAKTLLTDSQLPLAHIGPLAGFRSLSRFHEQMKTHYRMTPGQLRRAGRGTRSRLCFELAYRPPFDWSGLINYLGGRSLSGIEAIIDGRYCRSAALRDTRGKLHEGWLSVGHLAERNAVQLQISESLAAVIPQCLARVRALLDLDADPVAISTQLGDLASGQPGLRIPGGWDGFELAARAVLGQLISVRAATTLAGRIASHADLRIATPWAEVVQRFPSAEEFLALCPESLGRLGITRRNLAALRAIASGINSGNLDLSAGAHPMPARTFLLAIHGVGGWTFNYIAVRALRWPDAFPAGDLGVRKALGGCTTREADALSEQWRPWRAYALFHLWRSLT